MGRKRKPNKHKPPAPPKNSTPQGTLLSDDVDMALINKWPKSSTTLPPILIHNPTEIEDHVLKLLHLGIQFYKPTKSLFYTKIKFPSYQDQKEMSKYLEKNRIPFHTFGMPNNRKTKVVIKGLPHEIDVSDLSNELKLVSVPVVRMHRMQSKPGKDRPALYLAVIPQGPDGYRMFQVKKLFGHVVQLEPPKERPEQCHRCQRWGHAQRYCHGQIKCVKCGENHFSKRCTVDKKCPPKCANCGLEHTANYQNCVHSPMAPGHKAAWADKLTLLTVNQLSYHMAGRSPRPSEIVTYQNMKDLYRPSMLQQAVLDHRAAASNQDSDSDDNVIIF